MAAMRSMKAKRTGCSASGAPGTQVGEMTMKYRSHPCFPETTDVLRIPSQKHFPDEKRVFTRLNTELFPGVSFDTPCLVALFDDKRLFFSVKYDFMEFTVACARGIK